MLTSTNPPTSESGADTDSAENKRFARIHTFWQKWYGAFKQILLIYLLTRLAVLLINILSVLFLYSRPYQLYGKSQQEIPTPPISQLWHMWNVWPHDTPHFIEIAQYGYHQFALTAFFPLYPLFIRLATPLTHNDPLIAALLVSNLAGLIMLMVFYQMVKEDFDEVRALRATLYFSIFPSAFFFVAGYSETVFLVFAFLCFYQMRHGHWWLAGLFGFFAALARNTGIILAAPFAYEYLRQHEFRLKSLRFDVASAMLIPAGLGVYMLYCYELYKDPLAFQHAEVHWRHVLLAPWTGLLDAFHVMINSHNLLSFAAQRNAIELGSTFFILALLILSLVGPWRFPRTHLAYILFAVIVWIIPLCSPINPHHNSLPYQSLTRYMLEVFPAFIVLAALGKYRTVHATYLVIAGVLFFFLLTQFLLGYLII